MTDNFKVKEKSCKENNWDRINQWLLDSKKGILLYSLTLLLFETFKFCFLESIQIRWDGLLGSKFDVLALGRWLSVGDFGYGSSAFFK